MTTSFSNAFLPNFTKWVRLVILCFWRSIICTWPGLAWTNPSPMEPANRQIFETSKKYISRVSIPLLSFGGKTPVSIRHENLTDAATLSTNFIGVRAYYYRSCSSVFIADDYIIFDIKIKSFAKKTIALACGQKRCHPTIDKCVPVRVHALVCRKTS